MSYSSAHKRPHKIPLIAGFITLTLGIAGTLAGSTETLPSGPPSIGEEVRLFSIPDLDGHTVDVASLLQGKVALIAMWASWCQPCVAEIPGLRELATRYRDRGLVVLGVGLQQGEDTPAKQMDIAARRLVNYQLLFDAKSEYQTAYALRALPFSLLVGADGRIRWRGEALPGDLDARVRALVAEIPAAARPGG